MEMAVKEATKAAEPPEPLSTNLGWLLSQASYTLGTQVTAALEGLGISPRSYCLLTTAMTGEYTQIELAQRVGVDKTTMVVTLDELEANGLAKRRSSSEDRRARVVEVTKAGRAKVAKAEKIVEGIHEDVLANLPARERSALIDGLNRLVCGCLSKPTDCAHPARRRAPRA